MVSTAIEDTSNVASVERLNVWFRPGRVKSIKRFTNISLLVILAASCVSVRTCDAVKRTKPELPVSVMSPVDGWIVAILVFVEAYTMGAKLLLVGFVTTSKDGSVFILVEGTTKEDDGNVFWEFTMMVSEPAIKRIALTPYVLFSTTAFVA